MPTTDAIPSVWTKPPRSAIGLPSSPRLAAAAVEREELLDRLVHLRAILPPLAEELARARRQAAALRVENRRLLGEVRRLQGQREDTRCVQADPGRNPR